MRRMNEKLGVVLGASALSMALAVSGCTERTDATASQASSPSAATDNGAARAPIAKGDTAVDSSAPGVKLEMALRALDRGGQAAQVKSDLEAVLNDSRSSADEQDQAKLGLSRAREALGDKEGAISAVEEVLSAHADSRRFAAREPAENRLRLLLTGSETDMQAVTAPEKYAPVAKALSTYFQPDAQGETLVDVLVFGHNGTHLEDIGGLAIPAAKRDELRQACSFCVDNLKVSQSMSRTGSWIDIPRMAGEIEPSMPQIDRSLLVFFFDLDADRIPARYDQYLPIPSAEIVAHLEKGEGVIAMRERKGAKPTLVIAAPRTGELTQVQDAFAKLTALPKEPLVVPVDSHLAPEEIQAVVRASFGGVRACYKSLLVSEPNATGSVHVKFEIDADGSVKSPTLDTAHTTLNDATLTQCMLGVFSKMQFPSSAKSISVTYPIAFAPD